MPTTKTLLLRFILLFSVSSFAHADPISFCDQVLSLRGSDQIDVQNENEETLTRLQKLSPLIEELQVLVAPSTPLVSIPSYYGIVQKLLLSDEAAYWELENFILAKSRSESLPPLFRKFSTAIQNAAQRYLDNPSSFAVPQSARWDDFFQFVVSHSDSENQGRLEQGVQESLIAIDQHFRFVERSIPLVLTLARMKARNFYEQNHSSIRDYARGAAITAGLLLGMDFAGADTANLGFIVGGVSAFGLLYHGLEQYLVGSWLNDNVIDSHTPLSNFDKIVEELKKGKDELDNLFLPRPGWATSKLEMTKPSLYSFRLGDSFSAIFGPSLPEKVYGPSPRNRR